MSGKGKPTMMWVVGHPSIRNQAYVLAENWELATVAAAEYWGVPWARVAAECYKIESHEAHRNVCIKCHEIYFGEGPMCTRCMEKARAEQDYLKKPPEISGGNAEMKRGLENDLRKSADSAAA